MIDATSKNVTVALSVSPPFNNVSCVCRWVHLACALYTPGVAFINPDKLEGVTLSEIPPARWGAKVIIIAFFVCKLNVNILGTVLLLLDKSAYPVNFLNVVILSDALEIIAGSSRHTLFITNSHNSSLALVSLPLSLVFLPSKGVYAVRGLQIQQNRGVHWM